MCKHTQFTYYLFSYKIVADKKNTKDFDHSFSVTLKEKQQLIDAHNFKMFYFAVCWLLIKIFFSSNSSIRFTSLSKPQMGSNVTYASSPTTYLYHDQYPSNLAMHPYTSNQSSPGFTTQLRPVSCKYWFYLLFLNNFYANLKIRNLMFCELKYCL